MYRKFVFVVFVASLLTAHASYALVAVEAGAGYHKYNVKPDGESSFDIKATSLGVGVYVDPIPLVPVAFGVHGEWNRLGTSDFPVEPEAGAALDEVGVDIKAWVPAVPVITPYAKARYVAYSRMKLSFPDSASAKVADLTAVDKVTGWHLLAGFQSSLLPLISLFAEADYASLKWESDGEKIPINLLGVSVGINVSL